jgi:hypothetical protein
MHALAHLAQGRHRRIELSQRRHGRLISTFHRLIIGLPVADLNAFRLRDDQQIRGGA